MKIRPVAAEFFHAEGQADMMKLIVAFFLKNFASTPKYHVYIWERFCVL